jgi:hypothetical protein
LLAESTWRLRRALQEAEQWVHGGDRYVDFGIKLHVVRGDSRGRAVIPGMAPVVSVETRTFGGMLDTRTLQVVGDSERPAVWYASEAQLPLLLHDSTMPPKLLVFGAMGAGKTRTLAPWLVLRALEFTGTGIELGGTAPTTERLGMLTEALTAIMPADWYQYRAHQRLFMLRNGTRIRLIATTPRSAALGSPVQGWNWGASASDEIQDSLVANADIEARGRRAPDGVYRRFCTATAKDSPEWRTFRDKLQSSVNWGIERLEGRSNAFVFPAFWDSLKEEYDERTYQRLVLAMDVGPERATYPTFSREHNVRPVPQVGSKDITSKRVGAGGLLGHDPGRLQDVSLLLKCYRVREGRKDVEHWYVVDEWTTPQSTTEEHALHVKAELQDKWELQWPEPDEPKVIVRCDPYGDSDQRTDRSVYTTWKHAGFKILSAAYTPKGLGKGRVPKEAGIEMVNRLFCNAAGKRRLFIACDDKRKPCAPKLVEALEMSERDEHGKAETQAKNKLDLSHWAAALRYALWPYEKMRGSQGIRTGEALV